jgi:hypothetical protein
MLVHFTLAGCCGILQEKHPAVESPNIGTCSFFEGHEEAGQEALLPQGEQ